MSIFTGAGVAIITPFHADGSVNYEKLDELIQFHCDNGTDSIVICGTTGESSTLTEEEHMGLHQVYDQTDERTDSGHCRNRFQLYTDCSRDVKRSSRERCRWRTSCNPIL